MKKCIILYLLLGFALNKINAADITATKSSGCVPFSSKFSYGEAGIVSYYWEFGNGQTSTVASPTILFSNPGLFSVKLTISKTNGTSTTVFYDKNIEAIADPIPAFETDATLLCIKNTVHFNNLSTGSTNFLWDFGDGNTSAQLNPDHIYESSGSYTVTLIAYNDANCSEILSKPNVITVLEVEEIGIIANKQAACLNDANIVFSTSASYHTYLWDFGDGTTSALPSPAHKYSESGTYTISLNVTNANGCSEVKTMADFITVHDLPAHNIVISDSLICEGGTITFGGDFSAKESVEWIFSDGFTSNEKSFEKAFLKSGEYNFTVKVTNEFGCENTIDGLSPLKVISTAATNINFGETEGCVPFTVHIENNTSGVDSYEWELDGKILTGKMLDYTFVKEGKYTLKALMKHQTGCSNVVKFDSLFIVKDSKNSIIASSLKECSPATISFGLANKKVTNVKWNIGGVTINDEIAPSVPLTDPGAYNVEVSFNNEFGCPQTLELPKAITIFSNEITYKKPDPIVTCQSSEVYFNGGIGKDFWHWNFGDGSSSEDKNPSHFYKAPGTYSISLKTNNANGCEVFIEDYNRIIVSNIQASFSSVVADTTLGCPNFTMNFESVTPNANSYFWDFGNGITSTLENPSLDFSTNGQFPVSLTVIDEKGCSNTAIELVSSPWLYCVQDDLLDGQSPIPDSIFYRKHVVRMCSSPAEVQFANPRLQAKSWFWDFGDSTQSTEIQPKHTYLENGIYYVDLISFYEDGSIDTLDNFTEVIIEEPDANFEYSQEYICTGYEVAFQSISQHVLSYQWNFGDGTSSTTIEPTHVYTDPGVYQVALMAQDSAGCQKKVIKNIIVGNGFIQYDYQSNLCEGDTLSITHNIQGYDNFLWDFGDGNTSTDTFPKHLFSDSGEHEVKLEASSSVGGCKENFVLPEMVVLNQPKADFGVVNNKIGCNSLSVTFDNRSSGANNFSWDFGNSATSDQFEPTTTYNSGVYDVSLVSSINGCQDTMLLKEIIKVDSLMADFSFTLEDICLPLRVNFSDRSVNAVSWSWDFGDGGLSSSQNVEHTYNTYPTKPVTLKVTNAEGCSLTKSKTLDPLLKVDFDISAKNSCLNEEISFNNKSSNSTSWTWDFGDGNTSEEKSPVHRYSTSGVYTVSLISRSAGGCEMRMAKESLITVHDVKANFSTQIDESTCAPLLVKFINNSENADSYLWLFGDGSTSTNKDPIHIYNEPDQYNVSLIVKNKFNCSDTLFIENSVTVTGPRSKIILSDSVVCHPDSIQFDDKSNTAVNWEWLFGDGNTSTIRNPKYQYSSPGTYNVSLLSTDIEGCQQLVQYDSLVILPTPEAAINVQDYNYCLPVSINLVNESSKLQNATYQWSFGDGTTSNQFEPSHVFNNPGEYQISLLVTNEGLCSQSVDLNKPIMAYDTTRLIQPQVFKLSVFNENAIEMDCGPYTSNNFKYNVVYRKSNLANNYEPFDTLKSVDFMSYRDFEVNTSETSYFYKLQSHVYCHEPAALNALTQYKSIYVVGSIVDGDIQLSWEHYQGHTFDSYAIFRKGSTDDWKEIYRIDSKSSQFRESEDLCPGEYHYKIMAVNLNGKDYFSESNTTKVELLKNVFLDQKVEIARTTVVDDKYTYTEWREPEIGPDKVVYYEILRGDLDDSEVIDQVPAGVTGYYDENVDVQSAKYSYQVRVVNTCDIEAQLSNLGSSILLQRETDNYKSRIYWTPYEGWKNGVGKYKLQKLNQFGQWETVEELDSLKFETVIDLSKEN
ncbi:PKD domain-containing protein [Fulvivirga sp.]|uniref:PKD domain-containing protein n=1 Tax=Fulvivirga sp. TaxID=1931237 RepID=UPI0032F0762E